MENETRNSEAFLVEKCHQKPSQINFFHKNYKTSAPTPQAADRRLTRLSKKEKTH